MQRETIISKCYDFLKYSSPFIAKLPRSHKFTFGDRLQIHLFDLLELLIEAFYAPPARKKELLIKVNISLEKLRYLFRLGFDLGLYDSIRFSEFAKRLNEIGKMNGGWLKSLSK